MRGDDEQAGEQVGGNAVGGDDVFGAADGGFASVRGEDYDGRDGGFEGAVQVGEAFDVEHVDLKKGVFLVGVFFPGVDAREGGEGGKPTSSMKRTPGTSSATP